MKNRPARKPFVYRYPFGLLTVIDLFGRRRTRRKKTMKGRTQ